MIMQYAWYACREPSAEIENKYGHGAGPSTDYEYSSSGP